jgi:hypothetical protein
LAASAAIAVPEAVFEALAAEILEAAALLEGFSKLYFIAQYVSMQLSHPDEERNAKNSVRKNSLIT